MSQLRERFLERVVLMVRGHDKLLVECLSTMITRVSILSLPPKVDERSKGGPSDKYTWSTGTSRSWSSHIQSYSLPSPPLPSLRTHLYLRVSNQSLITSFLQTDQSVLLKLYLFLLIILSQLDQNGRKGSQDVSHL